MESIFVGLAMVFQAAGILVLLLLLFLLIGYLMRRFYSDHPLITYFSGMHHPHASSMVHHRRHH